MAEVERRPTTARPSSSTTAEPKKDPFKYVPDTVDELNREGTSVVNRYKRGMLLGKVDPSIPLSLSLSLVPLSSLLYVFFILSLTMVVSCVSCSQGGFAQVYLSQQTPSNNKVALKIVAKCSLQKLRAKQKVRSSSSFLFCVV